MDIKDIYKLFQQNPSIKTDTRKLNKGDIFFALSGPNFNGNNFAKQALDAGAAYVIIDENINLNDERIIKTDNVLQTLQQLGKYHREQFDIPFIAITGSNGKTTTKELIHHVLSSKYKTYTTQGNLNNHIGVPLTILKIKSDAQMAVIEMGANHLKEIESYCSYAKPTHGLITNIGKAHLEGFGGIEGVKKGKGELFDYLKANDGIAFVNWDDEEVKKLSSGIKNCINYGTAENHAKVNILSGSEFLNVQINDDIIKTKLVGEYNFDNVLAAVTVGNYFNISKEEIKSAIESYTPSNNRSQLIKHDTNTIILDAYNANPGSMKAAIENFANMPGDNKILLLGSMMELGDQSENEHKKIIEIINNFKWNKVVLVGENFKNISAYTHFDNSSDVKIWFKDQHFHDAQILVKGSRSMQMEKILQAD